MLKIVNRKENNFCQMSGTDMLFSKNRRYPPGFPKDRGEGSVRQLSRQKREAG